MHPIMKKTKPATIDEARLFLSFVRSVHSIPEEYITIHRQKRKIVKIRFKSVNSDVGKMLFYTKNLPILESNLEYGCTYCGAKYVYKRCLVTHMIKNHKGKFH